MTLTGPGSSSTAGPAGGWRPSPPGRPSRTAGGAFDDRHRLPPAAPHPAGGVTGQPLAFGFRAASADDPAELPAVAAVADLDLMQARRHAAVLTGYHLARDLTALRQADGMTGGAGWQPWRTTGLTAARRRPRGPGRLRPRPARRPAPGSGLSAGRDQPGTASRPPRTGELAPGNAGGGAGTGDRAAVRQAPRPLRMGRNSGHRGGHGRSHMGLPALAGGQQRTLRLTAAAPRHADAEHPAAAAGRR